MQFEETKLTGCYIIHNSLNEDFRGHFSRLSCHRELEKIGFLNEWVQINHSFTLKKGTLRGMHFQYPPHSDAKLIRCIRGSVYDVIVDIRKSSPNFLQSISVELSSENAKSVFIPEGFAHGFQTLEDNCDLIYFHSAYHTSTSEGGLLYSDPSLKIEWPLPIAAISPRDKNHSTITSSFIGI